MVEGAIMTARILIADADVTLTEVYRDHLARRGFAVQTAVTGLGCLARLRQSQPDLLLLGTSLLWGGCQGVLAVMDKEVDLRPEVVIVLARTPERKILRRLVPYDVDGYQWKPLPPSRLAWYVETVLMEHAEQHSAVSDR
jgi:DNA-binding response OmpR family regulator